jgi:glycerophosphoryl diester phosphodiesterase
MVSSVISPPVKSKLGICESLTARLRAHASTFARSFFDRPRLELPAERPLVLGHRGASGSAPENTLAAFREAMRQGADGVELDVRRCASGELVVSHDASLARVAGEDLLFERSTLSELRRADLGRRFGERFSGERIPTLEEVFEALPPEALIDIEIKADHLHDRGLTWQLARLLRRYPGRRFLLTSFNPAAVAQARAFAPEIPVGVLFEDARGLGLLGPLARVAGAAAIAPHKRYCSPQAVERWHRQGLRVAAWTVNERADIERCLSAGVDLLISNHPGRTLETLRQLQAARG